MQSGATQFIDWMERRWPGSNRPQREAAAHFGWDETFISMLRTGKRTPGLTNAIRLERETGIPVEAWVSSELDETVGVGSAKGGKRKQDKA